MTAVNSGVDALSTEVSALVMRSSPHARSVNGSALANTAAIAKCRHSTRSAAANDPSTSA